MDLDRLRQTLTPQQEHIFNALLRANGRTLSHDFLVQAMYPPPRDQPPGAHEVLKTQIYLLRRKLCCSTPYSVRKERGAGYSLHTIDDALHCSGGERSPTAPNYQRAEAANG